MSNHHEIPNIAIGELDDGTTYFFADLIEETPELRDWIYQLMFENQHIKREIASHGPEGRNYTNEQYIDMQSWMIGFKNKSEFQEKLLRTQAKEIEELREVNAKWALDALFSPSDNQEQEKEIERLREHEKILLATYGELNDELQSLREEYGMLEVKYQSERDISQALAKELSKMREEITRYREALQELKHADGEEAMHIIKIALYPKEKEINYETHR